MKKYFAIVFFAILIIPSVASASWWNPFSWNVFRRANTQTQVIENKLPNVVESEVDATKTVSTSTPKVTTKVIPTKSISTEEKKVTKTEITPTQKPPVPTITKTDSTQNTVVEPTQKVPKQIQKNTTSPAPTPGPVYIPTPTPAPTQPTPDVNPYSDYVFVNTSPAVGDGSQWQIQISIAPTNRDIRVRRAVFKVSDEDAITLDTIGTAVGGSPLWLGLRLNNKIIYYTAQLQRTDKNTFTYEATNGSSGISLGQLPLFLALYTLSPESFDTNKALMANIKMPMSEWIIMDQSNGKPVKVQ